MQIGIMTSSAKFHTHLHMYRILFYNIIIHFFTLPDTLSILAQID